VHDLSSYDQTQRTLPKSIWAKHDWPKVKREFTLASPFQHAVIDQFFDEDLACLLERNISSLKFYPTSFRSLAQKKDQLSNITLHVPTVRPAFDQLADDKFLAVLKDLTGMPDLAADAKLVAAGIHRLPPGGFNEIHLDANRHPLNACLHRRVNLIVYLNRDWNPNWGGRVGPMVN
jgi:Rps23 Pro-64 3,4-dihydroxylase Tpa1-like proline 4-hydroxylase